MKGVPKNATEGSHYLVVNILLSLSPTFSALPSKSELATNWQFIPK
jgi:hypothetical protein